ILCPFNDASAVAEILGRFPGVVASVILEPAAGNMGLVPPRPGFLERLRDLSEKDGALLVFDEVMTGVRLGEGGAQVRFGVTPDMTVLGKIIGGGLPAAAYGGKRSLMDHVSPAGRVYQAGTLSGNPLAMAAGLATLRVLGEERPYPTIEALTTRLAEGLDRAATDEGVPHVVQHVGSMITLFFNPKPVHDYDDARRSDTRFFGRFFWEMLARGIYLPCSQFEAAFLSTAHTTDDIDQTVAAAREALRAAKD
ncbi:MAG: aminotransferase class III-fold pyridoxal phosphate-dependent enzyme, partial [Isosphaeraceae bacterium]